MKGVSPLVAAVLLIAFTVSVSMIIMGWFSTFVRGTTANVSGTTEEALACQMASISIEHVYIKNSSTGAAKILVKNTGFVDLTVNAMVFNKTGASCYNNSDLSLPKGSSLMITLTNGTPDTCPIFKGKACSETFDRAVVTTNCGGVSDTVTSLSYVTVNGESCA